MRCLSRNLKHLQNYIGMINWIDLLEQLFRRTEIMMLLNLHHWSIVSDSNYNYNYNKNNSQHIVCYKTSNLEQCTFQIVNENIWICMLVCFLTEHRITCKKRYWANVYQCRREIAWQLTGIPKGFPWFADLPYQSFTDFISWIK